MSYWEKLSDAERVRLSTGIEEALDRLFPPNIRVGASPQQDYYFHQLLRRLISNARQSGIPAVAGSHPDLYRFIYECYPAWVESLALPKGKQAPARTDEANIDVVASQWGKSIRELRMRSTAIGGVTFVIHYQQGLVRDGGELIISVEAIRFRTSDGFLHIPQVTSASDDTPTVVRLPPRDGLVISEADTEKEREKIIARLLKDFRGNRLLRKGYEKGLAKESLARLREIAHEQRAAQKSGNYKAYAASVLAVVLAACAIYYYSVVYHRNVPIVLENHGDHFHLANVQANDEGKIAVFDAAGKRITEWGHVIRDPNTGTYIEITDWNPVTHSYATNVLLTPRSPIQIEASVPAIWRENGPTPLPMQATYYTFGIETTVWFFVDIRTLPKSIVSQALPFYIRFVRDGTLLRARSIVLNTSHTRYAIGASYRYAHAGDYNVSLYYGTHYDRAFSDNMIGKWQATITLHIQPGQQPQLVAVNRPDKAEQRTVTAKFFRLSNGAISPAQIVLFPEGGDNRRVVVTIIPDYTTWPRYAALRDVDYTISLSDGRAHGKNTLNVNAVENTYTITQVFSMESGKHTVTLRGRYNDRELPPLALSFSVSDTVRPQPVGIEPGRVYSGGTGIVVDLSRPTPGT